MAVSNNQKGKSRPRLLGLGILVILLGLGLWWIGPLHFSRIVPDDVVLCQVLYIDLTDSTSEQITGSITLEQEDMKALVDFLHGHSMRPVWKVGVDIRYMNIDYTLLFYDESTLRAQASVTDRGEVKIGNRTYQLFNWTESDGVELYSLIMEKR